jgi:hypothetical protein
MTDKDFSKTIVTYLTPHGVITMWCNCNNLTSQNSHFKILRNGFHYRINKEYLYHLWMLPIDQASIWQRLIKEFLICDYSKTHFNSCLRSLKHFAMYIFEWFCMLWLIPHPLVLWQNYGSMECIYICMYVSCPRHYNNLYQNLPILFRMCTALFIHFLRKMIKKHKKFKMQ